jgi:rhodanese-related sulfurtransferase
MHKFSLCLALFCCLLLHACESEAQTKLAPDAYQAALQAAQNVQLVDVRTPDEFRSGHLAGAMNINFHDTDFAQQMARLDKEKPLMVYCAVGGRSGKAAAQLTQMGFKNVTDLQGGFNAWKAQGKPVEQ